MLTLMLWLACTDPIPLPAPKATSNPTDGRMVKVAQVHGYLARPKHLTPDKSVLLLVDQTDEATQAAVDAAAAPGLIVLAISPEVQTRAAVDYLQELPGVTGVQIECRRVSCP